MDDDSSDDQIARQSNDSSDDAISSE